MKQISILVQNRVSILCICFACGIVQCANFDISITQILLFVPIILCAFYFTQVVGFFCISFILGAICMKHRIESIKATNSTFLPLSAFITAKVEKVSNNKLILSDIRHLSEQIRKLPLKAAVYTQDPLPAVNDIISCKANFQPSNPPLAPKGYDQRFYYFFEHIQAGGKISDVAIIQKPARLNLRQFIKQRLVNQLGEHADMSCAILLNDRSLLSKQTIKDFNTCGFGHMLAISGLHLAILSTLCALIVKFILRLVFCKIHYCLPISPLLLTKIITITTVGFYLSLIGLGFSILRASGMLVLNLWLWWQDRNVTLNNLVHLTALILMICLPECVFYPSFQLSFVAMLGFALLKSVKIKGFKAYLLKTLQLTLIMSAITFPITLFHFKQLALQPFTTNILFMPYLSLIFIPCAFLSPLLPKFVMLYQTMFVKFAMSKMALISITWSGFHLPPYALAIYCLTISFIKTELKFITYIGWIIMTYLTFIQPNIVGLVDQFGRIARKESATIYTHSKNESFISKLEEYWGLDKVEYEDKSNLIKKLTLNKYDKGLMIDKRGNKINYQSPKWFYE